MLPYDVSNHELMKDDPNILYGPFPVVPVKLSRQKVMKSLNHWIFEFIWLYAFNASHGAYFKNATSAPIQTKMSYFHIWSIRMHDQPGLFL